MESFIPSKAGSFLRKAGCGGSLPGICLALTVVCSTAAGCQYNRLLVIRQQPRLR